MAKQVLNDNVLFAEQRSKINSNFDELYDANVELASEDGSSLVGYLPSGTGAVPRDVQSKLRESVSVKDFGAVGDGVTDDTAAINAAFSHIRSLIVKANGITQGESVKLVFGGSGDVFKVTGSINATGLKGLNVVIDGGGAVILGACAGLPVFDMRNSRWYSINNLSIWGDATNTPSYGIVMGRTLAVASSAGDGSFNDCALHGHYTKACLYNFTSETVQYRHCRFYNRYVGTGANCIVMDGVNNYNVASEFTAQENAADTPVSFNENNFYGCDFRREAGTGVDACIRYIGFASRHGYLLSYAANVSGDILELYRPYAGLAFSDLIMDMHAEVDNVTSGVRNMLLIDTASASATVNVYGLKIRDHAPQCRNSMVDTTGGVQIVALDACEIDCGDPKNTIPIFGATSAAGKLLFSGDIKWLSSKALSFGSGYVNGNVYVRDSTSITATVGAYKVVRRPTATASRLHEFKGYLRVLGTGDGTAPDSYAEIRGAESGGSTKVVAGGVGADISLSIAAKGLGAASLEANNAVVVQAIAPSSSVNYVRAQAAPAGGAVSVSVQGSDSNIDLLLASKGTGNVRFGTYATNADAPITGYITIKDASGTVRKLAVIS